MGITISHNKGSTDLVLDNHPKKHLKQKVGSNFVPEKPLKKATWLGIYSWSRGCETHRWRPNVSSKAMRSALSNGPPIEEGGDLTHPTVTRPEDGELRVWVEILNCYFSASFWKPASVIENVTIRNLEGQSSRRTGEAPTDGKLRILHLGESWESVCVWKG